MSQIPPEFQGLMGYFQKTLESVQSVDDQSIRIQKIVLNFQRLCHLQKDILLQQETESPNIQEFDVEENINIALTAAKLERYCFQRRSLPDYTFLPRLFIDRKRWNRMYDMLNKQFASIFRIAKIVAEEGFNDRFQEYISQTKPAGPQFPEDPIEEEYIAALTALTLQLMVPAEKGRLLSGQEKEQRLYDVISNIFDAKEPGYCASMRSGFEYVQETLGQKFTSEEFKILHRKCVETVGNMVESESGTEYATHDLTAYHFLPEYMTEDARKEAEEETLIYFEDAKGDFLHYLGRFRPADSDGPSMIVSLKNARSSECVDAFFAEYYAKIAEAKSEDDKLFAIAGLCRKLEILHAFTDGNQRTVAFAILTKLLIENGFSPTIIREPVMFDGYFSTRELVEAVKEGMDYYKREWTEYQKDH